MEANVDEVNIVEYSNCWLVFTRRRIKNKKSLLLESSLHYVVGRDVLEACQATHGSCLHGDPRNQKKMKLFSTASSPVAIFNQIFQSKLKQSCSL